MDDIDEPVERDAAGGDHDLLTYGEAGVRLHEEVAAQRAVVAALERNATAEESPALAAAHRRLELLEEAAARNRRQPINDENFAAFFGYEGTARRNT